MKTLLLFFVLFLFSFYATQTNAQVKVGDNAKNIHPSAALEVESHTKGFLPPRMSRDSMNLIAAPAVGLVVYNTTNKSLFIRQPNGWVPLSVGRQAWGYTDSTHIYNLNNSNVGIGTTTPSSKLQVNGDVKLQKGANVNEVSTDSTFAASSDSMLVTEKAIKAYLKSGKFIGGSNTSTGGSTITAEGTTSQNLDHPRSVAVQGSYAYVANAGNNSLSIYDISNPNTIVVKATSNQNLSIPYSVAVQSSYAYVANYYNSLAVFNYQLAPAIPMASGDSLTYSNVLADYATTASLSNYATNASLSNYVSLSGDQTIGGRKTFSDSLTVIRDNQGITQQSANGNVKVGFWANSTKAYVQTVTNTPLWFATNNGYASMALDVNGNLGIGTTTPSERLYVAGNIRATGTVTATSFTQSSDIRFKQNILPLQNALSSIMALKGVSWLWKTDEYKQFGSGKQIGFVAQDVEKVVPEVVATDAQGYKSIDYAKLTAVLTEAMKAQEKKIEALEKKVVELSRHKVK